MKREVMIVVMKGCYGDERGEELKQLLECADRGRLSDAKRSSLSNLLDLLAIACDSGARDARNGSAAVRGWR